MPTRLITLGALFLALGLLIPLLFHLLGLGAAFLPMHIPVMLAGFLLGPAFGAGIGALSPLLSALLTGMPPLMPPVAQTMILELAAYGGLAGLAYQRWRWGIYPALLLAMLGGRLVYGLVGYFLLPLFGLKQIALFYPLTYGLVTALPGIALQLVLIPAVVWLAVKNHGPLFGFGALAAGGHAGTGAGVDEQASGSMDVRPQAGKE